MTCETGNIPLLRAGGVRGGARQRRALQRRRQQPSPSPSRLREGSNYPLLHQPAREFSHAINLVGDAAQFLVESNLCQFLRLIVERNLQILFPEEFRIGQARCQNLFIARNNRRAAVMRVDIRGADKGIGKLAIGVMADKIFLVHTRCQLNDFLRDFQKGRVKAAKHRHWPFGQSGVFDNQPFIRHQSQASCLCGSVCSITDDPAAFGKMDEDMGVAQLFCVIASIADGDWATVMETVPHGGSATDDVVDCAIHDIVAQESNDPLQRTNPAQAFGRGRCRAPALRLWPGESTNDRRNGFGENIGSLTLRLLHDREIDTVAFDQLVFGQASFAQEALHGLRRRANLGPLGFFGNRLGRQRQSSRNQRQAARRSKSFDRSCGNPCLRQSVVKQARKVFLGLHLHTRRNFFGTEFKQEIGHTNSSPLAGRGTVLARWRGPSIAAQIVCNTPSISFKTSAAAMRRTWYPAPCIIVSRASSR